MKREEDTIKGLYVAATHDYLLIFTNLGRCYWLKVWQIPETGRKSKGKPLINLLEDLRPEEKIATILRVSSFEEEDTYILMATSKGYRQENGTFRNSAIRAAKGFGRSALMKAMK